MNYWDTYPACVNDVPADQLAIVEPWLERHGPFDRALDLGCGGARWFPVLSQYARSYVGLDNSDVRLGVCRTRFPSETFVGELCGLSGIDLVFCCTVLIHVKDAASLMQCAYEACRDGARALLWESVVPDNARDRLIVRHAALPPDKQFMAYRTAAEMRAVMGPWTIESETTLTWRGDEYRLYSLVKDVSGSAPGSQGT